MNDDQQAVVEQTETEATPSVEGANAPDELDALLGEFQAQETEPTTTAASSAEISKLDEVHTMLKDNQLRDTTRINSERITDAVKMFKNSVGLPITDEMAEVILQGKAAKDVRIQQAFNNAGVDPAGWNKVVKAVAKDYAKQVAETPNQDATADQNAVVAAVQSASTKAPTADNVTDDQVATMSTADFNALQRSLGVHP